MRCCLRPWVARGAAKNIIIIINRCFSSLCSGARRLPFQLIRISIVQKLPQPKCISTPNLCGIYRSWSQRRRTQIIRKQISQLMVFSRLLRLSNFMFVCIFILRLMQCCKILLSLYSVHPTQKSAKTNFLDALASLGSMLESH